METKTIYKDDKIIVQIHFVPLVADYLRQYALRNAIGGVGELIRDAIFSDQATKGRKFNCKDCTINEEVTAVKDAEQNRYLSRLVTLEFRHEVRDVLDALKCETAAENWWQPMLKVYAEALGSEPFKIAQAEVVPSQAGVTLH